MFGLDGRTFLYFRPLNVGVTGDVAVSRNQDGRLEVFVRGEDNHLWHIWQLQPNGDWSDWEDMNTLRAIGIGFAGNPAVPSGC